MSDETGRTASWFKILFIYALCTALEKKTGLLLTTRKTFVLSSFSTPNPKSSWNGVVTNGWKKGPDRAAPPPSLGLLNWNVVVFDQAPAHLADDPEITVTSFPLIGIPPSWRHPQLLHFHHLSLLSIGWLNLSPWESQISSFTDLKSKLAMTHCIPDTVEEA